MAHERSIPQHQAEPRADRHGPVGFAHGAALGGVGVAAAVVGQLPVKLHLKRTLAYGHEQNIDPALADSSLRPVQA